MRSQDQFLREIGLDPDIVTAKGKLSPDGTVLQDTFKPIREKQQHLLRTLWHASQVIRTAVFGNSLAAAPANASRLLRVALERRSPPNDTVFYTSADVHLRRIFAQNVHQLLTAGSGLANAQSAANLVRAHELKRSGQSVASIPFPHTSFLDPLIRQVILERTAASSRQPEQVQEAAHFLGERTVTAIGQKVPLKAVTRVTSASLDAVVTITPNHRCLDEEFASAHGRVFGEISSAVKKHPLHHWMIFPESGRTKFFPDSPPQIRIPYLIPTAVKRDEWLVPEFYEGPYGLWNTDKETYESFGSAVDARYYVGEPFQLQAGSLREKPIIFIRRCREALRKVGAPVDTCMWAYTKPNPAAEDRIRHQQEAWRARRDARRGAEEAALASAGSDHEREDIYKAAKRADKAARGELDQDVVRNGLEVDVYPVG